MYTLYANTALCKVVVVLLRTRGFYGLWGWGPPPSTTPSSGLPSDKKKKKKTA